MADTSDQPRLTLLDADADDFCVPLASQRTSPSKRASPPPFLYLSSPLAMGGRRTDGSEKWMTSDLVQSKMVAQQRPLGVQRWTLEPMTDGDRLASVHHFDGGGIGLFEDGFVSAPAAAGTITAPAIQPPIPSEPEQHRGFTDFRIVWDVDVVGENTALETAFVVNQLLLLGNYLWNTQLVIIKVYTMNARASRYQLGRNMCVRPLQCLVYQIHVRTIGEH